MRGSRGNALNPNYRVLGHIRYQLNWGGVHCQVWPIVERRGTSRTDVRAATELNAATIEAEVLAMLDAIMRDYGHNE